MHHEQVQEFSLLHQAPQAQQELLLLENKKKATVGWTNFSQKWVCRKE